MPTVLDRAIPAALPPEGLARRGEGFEPPSAPEEAGPAPKAVIGFALFIVLNAVLFIRPAEIVPDVQGWPIYEVVILACLAFSLPAVWERLRPQALAAQPINLCVFGLLLAVVLSQVSHFRLGVAYDVAFPFAKVMVYYLLLVSLLTTLPRLRIFLFFLVLFVIVLAVLALLQYHGTIDIPSLATLNERKVNQETGEVEFIRRLVSTGIYNDPNDLCLILLVGMAVSLYWLTDRASGPLRFWALAPLGLFGYALALTQSRGGFMALLAGMLVLLCSRFGWKKTLPLAVVALPVMLLLFGGRQTDVDLSDPEDSGQARIQLWREGLEYFKESPVFGIGKDEYADRAVQVAHNSFVHCFAELGFFGGTLFTGAFFLAAWSLHRVGKAAALVAPDVLRLRPYVLASVAAYVVGMCSLSRAYIGPTYMVPGLAAAYLALPGLTGRVPLPRFGLRLGLLLVGVSILTLATLHFFVLVFAK